jgi:hypothetical protein
MFSIRMTASRMASTIWRTRHCFGGLRIKREALLDSRLTIAAHNVSCFRICQEDLNIDVQLQRRVDKEHVR